MWEKKKVGRWLEDPDSNLSYILILLPKYIIASFNFANFPSLCVAGLEFERLLCNC